MQLILTFNLINHTILEQGWNKTRGERANFFRGPFTVKSIKLKAFLGML